jgi:hypothetical protein
MPADAQPKFAYIKLLAVIIIGVAVGGFCAYLAAAAHLRYQLTSAVDDLKQPAETPSWR